MKKAIEPPGITPVMPPGITPVMPSGITPVVQNHEGEKQNAKKSFLGFLSVDKHYNSCFKISL